MSETLTERFEIRMSKDDMFKLGVIACMMGDSKSKIVRQWINTVYASLPAEQIKQTEQETK